MNIFGWIRWRWQRRDRIARALNVIEKAKSLTASTDSPSRLNVTFTGYSTGEKHSVFPVQACVVCGKQIDLCREPFNTPDWVKFEHGDCGYARSRQSTPTTQETP